MKKTPILLAAAGALALASQASQALPIIDLFEYAFNIDGTVSHPTLGDPVPGSVNLAGFDTTTGIGTILMTLTGAGSHYAATFLDHEIDQAINTYFNEYGTTSGSPDTGQSWEIDEPGYVFGDIYDNFLGSALDNSNAVPSSLADDVSMAMGWDFSLGASETATIDFVLSETQPTSGFYLTQTDPDSEASIYMSSSLGISSGGPTPNPAPATLALMALGLLGLRRFAGRREG
jgi:MYXO-CTERM domain-containing protein